MTDYRTQDVKRFSPKRLQFPIQVKQMSIKQTKEYHLKRLYELCLKSIVKGDQ